MKFNISEHIAELTDEQKLKIEEVHTNQKKFGMTPRTDSILTYNYALGNVPDYLNDAETVAKELVIVDYIFKNTNYSAIIEDVMREIAYHLKYKYRLDWNTTWDMTRFYVPDMLKLYCIKKNGGFDDKLFK